jgi:hypothetical protein
MCAPGSLSVWWVSARYEYELDSTLGAKLSVDYKTVRGVVVDYAIVLLLWTGDRAETIRLYDSAHGFNEMHRYTRSGGKQSGTEFHSGTLGEGMLAAIADIEDGYRMMVEGWRR